VMALVAVALTVLPDLVCPRADGRWSAEVWYSTFLSGLRVGGTAAAAGAWAEASFLNQSLSGTLHRLLTDIEPKGTFQLDHVHLVAADAAVRKVVTLAAQALVGLLVLVACLSGRGRALPAADGALHRFGQVGAVACGMVLLSPMSSKSHFCVLLFATAFCVADLLYRRRDAVVVVLLAAVFACTTLSTKDIVGKSLGNQLLARGSVTWAALLTLLATVHVLFWRARRAAEAPLPARPPAAGR
jgi:hypothetical protein